uniref:acid phosphatase n=1 Tax=Romanomermis culicivorax TaxID=13658 RepID=A0A915KP05_ROMCU
MWLLWRMRSVLTYFQTLTPLMVTRPLSSSFGTCRGRRISLWILSFTLLLASISPTNGQQLVFVQALWRHGERNPIHTIPTDTLNKPESWTTGLGELTMNGISVQYKLGQALKKRYVNFIDFCQLHKQAYLWSTDYNRTLMSAAVLHSGLKEQNCSDIGGSRDVRENVLELWSPFPVHSVPNDMDQSIVSIPCPKYEVLNKMYTESSEEIKEFESKNKNFLKFMSQLAGVSLAAMNISTVMDPLLNTKIQSDSHAMPEWVNDTIYNVGLSLWNQSVFLSYKNVSVTKFFIGSLLWNIVELFRAKIQNVFYLKDLKFHGYSVFFTLDYPAVDDAFIEKRLSGCPPLPNSCSFEKFTARNEPYFIKNVSTECRTEKNVWKNALISRKITLIVTVLIFTLLTLGCLILLVLIAKRFSDDKRRYDGYYRVQLDSMADGFLSDRMIRFKNGKIVKEPSLSNNAGNSLVLMHDEKYDGTDDEDDISAGNNDL